MRGALVRDLHDTLLRTRAATGYGRLGADVRLAGLDFDAAKDAAREYASASRARFVEDGAEPAVAVGAGTIAVELGAHSGLLDAVLVPVGNGALITGIGAWVKAFA